MRRRILRGVTAGLLAVTPILSLSSAGAAGSPETFEMSASTGPIRLGLLGQVVEVGATEASVSGVSDLTASARAFGGVAPLINGSVSEVSVSGPGKSSTGPEECVVVLDQIPGVDAAVACTNSSVSTVDGLPAAAASADVADVTVAADDLLDLVGLSDVLSDGVTTVLDSLSPVFSLLTGTPLEGLDGTLNDLLDGVLNTSTASVSVGDASSVITTTADTVTSTATSSAATVSLLPDLPTGALAVVEVSPGVASASYDRASGEIVLEATPAVATVTLAGDLLDGLGLGDVGVIEVAPGAEICPDLPEPLSLCVRAHEASFDEESGTVDAGGVHVSILGGVNGGVTLDLGDAVVSASGAPAVAEDPVPPVSTPPTTIVEGPPTQAPNPAPELPKTGAGSMLPVALLLAAAAVPGLSVLRRSRI